MWGAYRPYYEKEIVSMGISSWQWLRYRINVKKVWSSVEKCVKNRETNLSSDSIEEKHAALGLHGSRSGSEKRKSTSQTRKEAKCGSEKRKSES